MHTSLADTVVATIAESIDVKSALMRDRDAIAKIVTAAERCVTALRGGKKIMLAGNGGSAADAQHFAAELVNRFESDRGGLAAMSLTTDSSVLTAIGNDYDFERLFSRQIEALGTAGDVFIGISTSGNSANIVAALAKARELGILAICLTGMTGGRIMDVCDICIRVPATNTARIQEAHITIAHIICGIVEKALFAEQVRRADRIPDAGTNHD